MVVDDTASAATVRHIVLVGMMGSGKTTVGTALAARLARPFTDTDHEIETRSAMSITAMFETQGEAAFRDAEARVVADVLADEVPGVISLGGGAVLDTSTRELLVGHSVVWLDAPVEVLASRVAGDPGRPLLADDPDDALQRLVVERRPIYEGVADVVVDGGAPVDQIVDLIVHELVGLTGPAGSAESVGVAEDAPC